MKHDEAIGRIRGDLEDFSKLLFSKKYRLELAALITAQEPPIWARQLARALEIGENQAASELTELEKLGALQRFPDDFDRRKLYVVSPHRLWSFARETLEARIREGHPEQQGDELISSYWAYMLDGNEPRPLHALEDDS